MHRDNTAPLNDDESSADPADGTVDEAQISDWLRRRAGEYLLLSAEEIDPNADLGRYGLDSLGAEELLQGAQEWLEIPISSAAISTHRTVNALARHLAAEKRR